MSLIEGMKDSSLGAIILYSFTKGYGSCEIDLYDYVLPLIYNDTFKRVVLHSETLEEALLKAVDGQPGFLLELKGNLEKYASATNQALGILMLQNALEYRTSSGKTTAILKEAPYLDVNEAISLGQLVKDNETLLKNAFDWKPLKIGILDSNSIGQDIELSRFDDYGDFIDYHNLVNLEGVAKDHDIIITNKVRMDETSLADFDQLKLICVTATGYNNLDLDYLEDKGIASCNVKGYSTKAVASHGLSLMMALNNHLLYYDNFVKSKEYSSLNSFSHFSNTFYELDNKVLTIVGMGAIGQEMAKYATVLGMKVQYYSTSGLNSKQPYERVNFATALTTSDFISINAPLNESTENLFDYQAFKKMKNSAYIVNVGRGKIINEADLVRALNEDEIAGAALDVFENEPLPGNSCLFEVEDGNKLILTPHIAWAPFETRQRVIDEIQKNIEAFLIGAKRNRL